jgi:hypothetical protein
VSLEDPALLDELLEALARRFASLRAALALPGRDAADRQLRQAEINREAAEFAALYQAITARINAIDQAADRAEWLRRNRS